MNNQAPNRKIFLDAGALNGCSVKKFTQYFPDFEIFSFDPNPYLCHHFIGLNTHHYPVAVWTTNKKIPFYLDERDFDGSSVYKHKKNIVGGKQIEVDAIDLDAFIRKNFKPTDFIILKMDIEGAEYPVLSKLVETRTILYINELLIEWHYKKINHSEYEHNLLVEKLKELNIPMHKWDAITSYTKDINYLRAKYADLATERS